MLNWILKKFLGSKNDRDIKALLPKVVEINRLERDMQALTEEQLQAKTVELRQRLAQGATLDDIMCEAFAVAKNACRRMVGRTFDVCGQTKTWVEVPFDVQLIGGIVIHQGKIAEMATGEGKTLVAVAPVYLNALAGKGVHVVTVNDYLALRDAEWMGQVYRYLGLTVGCIQNSMRPEERREMYARDITYGTNSEFGFDYLRDNMSYRPEHMVQRGHAFAIVDEIDSILIDEARTPLIISGPAQQSNSEEFVRMKPPVERLVKKQRDLIDTLAAEAEKLVADQKDDEAAPKLYQVQQGMPRHPLLLRLIEEPATRRLLEKVNNRYLTETHKNFARELREELFFTIDEKGHDATLTEKGCAAMSPNDPDAYVLPDLPTLFSEIDGNHDLPPEEKIARRQRIQEEYALKNRSIHAVDQLIRAYCMYERDVQYIVEDNQVVIVDENTGRKMTGRRWSDGLHQAVEAKEGVKIERETQTLATVTIQNYFRMYAKLAGMTGTAETEADEFFQIYKLDVVVIPTNRPIRRVDWHDQVYKTRREKEQAVVAEVIECYKRKQPILIGTVTVEASERLSRLLQQQGIPHNVLNAKNHAREAEIVARAGQPGAVTIATNMAGRGTDIKLGPGVVWVPEDLVKGMGSLDNIQVEGGTLRKALLDKPCGLYVLGTERHDSRRVDRQLRGRCSRQGDPGMSRFYVSLEDDLMRLFGSDRLSGVMEKLGLKEGEVLESGLLNKSIERAQKKVEQHNFSQRKRVLEYDDVMNKQREVIYGLRGEVLRSANPRDVLFEQYHQIISDRAHALLADKDPSGLTAFAEWATSTFPVPVSASDFPAGGDAEAAAAVLLGKVKEAYNLKVQADPPEVRTDVERHIMLMCIDNHWQEYLRHIDAMRQSIYLVSYAQKDPLVEFKREAYEMFSTLVDTVRNDIAQKSFQAQIIMQPPADAEMEKANRRMLRGEGGPRRPVEPPPPPPEPTPEERQKMMVDAMLERAKAPPPRQNFAKVGRNDPCPCGSGKKFKKCHGTEE